MAHKPLSGSCAMRIVYLLTSLGMGGAERLTLALAERMRERGHAVALFTLMPRLEEEWPTALPVFRLGMRKDPFSVAIALWRARRYLRDLRPDLIHSHGFHPNIVSRLLKPLVLAPAIVATIHNVYEGGRLRMFAYRVTDFLCDRVTTVSQAAADRFIALGAVSARQCVVIPNAIDLTEFMPSPERRVQMRSSLGAGADFIWLAAGRIMPAKDYPNLLRAFANVRASQPSTQLWIAGQGSNAALAELRSLAAELNIAGAVRWLGLQRDMPALLDAADGFVLSSAWEGMPLVLAEAMAMEKPIVATDVGGVRELLGEFGSVVAPRAPEQLAQAMHGVMLQTEDARREQGRAARQRIEQNFSIDARANDYEALYRSLC
jgi:glycosyltransferase involved in cell wall biosynthesis